MEELLCRYSEVKRVLDSYTKKMKQVRDKIKRELGKEGNFENDLYRIELQQKTRSSIVRKDTPSDVWQTYATTTAYETLHIVEKKKGG